MTLKQGSFLTLFSQNSNSDLLNRNLKIYPYLYVLQNIWLWGGSFFLFFNERVSLDQILLLQSIYYFSVVLLEVPSGFSSDILGRKITLFLANIMFLIAYIFMFNSTEFLPLAVGQILIAAGFAFISGTDQSFHFESLKALGREDHFPHREAKLIKNTLMVRSFTAVLGGAIALYSLRLPYLFSGILSLSCIIVILFLVEPPREKSNYSLHKDFFKQVRDCLKYLDHPKLKWLFLFSIFCTTIAHVQYEYYQGYIDLLNIRWFSEKDQAPLISGILRGTGLLITSIVAGYSIRLRDRFGFTNCLLFGLGFLILVIAAMSSVLHIAILGFIIFRGAPNGMIRTLSRAEIIPLTDSINRATFLSLQSFSGRLLHGLSLLILSLLLNSESSVSWANLSYSLRAGLLISVVLFGFLLFTRKWTQQKKSTT